MSDNLKIRGIKRKFLVAELVKGGYTKSKDMIKILSTKIASREDPTVKQDNFSNLDDENIEEE